MFCVCKQVHSEVPAPLAGAPVIASHLVAGRVGVVDLVDGVAVAARAGGNTWESAGEGGGLDTNAADTQGKGGVLPHASAIPSLMTGIPQGKAVS